jgi:hypothetical protein
MNSAVATLTETFWHPRSFRSDKEVSTQKQKTGASIEAPVVDEMLDG